MSYLTIQYRTWFYGYSILYSLIQSADIFKINLSMQQYLF